MFHSTLSQLVLDRVSRVSHSLPVRVHPTQGTHFVMKSTSLLIPGIFRIVASPLWKTFCTKSYRCATFRHRIGLKCVTFISCPYSLAMLSISNAGAVPRCVADAAFSRASSDKVQCLWWIFASSVTNHDPNRLFNVIVSTGGCVTYLCTSVQQVPTTSLRQFDCRGV